MKWIISWTIALFVVFAAAVGVAKAIGSLSSSRAAVLHLTDCQLPCWLNIEPGKTDYADADKRLKAAFADLPDYTLVTIPDVPDLVELKSNPNSPEAISPIWLSLQANDPSSPHPDYLSLQFTQGDIEGHLVLVICLVC